MKWTDPYRKATRAMAKAAANQHTSAELMAVTARLLSEIKWCQHCDSHAFAVDNDITGIRYCPDCRRLR